LVEYDHDLPEGHFDGPGTDLNYALGGRVVVDVLEMMIENVVMNPWNEKMDRF
jgi:hypothetical protein